MRLIRKLSDWRSLRASAELNGRSIGFVPTLGALHRGHRSLLERSRRESDVTVLSIFVNPTQFDDPKDLAGYPATLESDLAMAREAGVSYVLAPEAAEMYPDRFRYRASEQELSKLLCGAHRPGHFDGMLTVVLKLLNLVRPNRAYFGEKDYQQYLLVRGMSEALFLETEIVPCPIVRDEDGLALSSRNTRLTRDERALAAEFPAILQESASAATARAELDRLGFAVDYIEDQGGRRFGAVRLGAVRLIDNVEVPPL